MYQSSNQERTDFLKHVSGLWQNLLRYPNINESFVWANVITNIYRNSSVLNVCVSRSVMSDSLLSHGLYSPWNSPGQNTGVGSLSLLQRIFPAQGSEPGLPHCRWILYQLSHKGSPVLNRTLQNLWVLEQLSSLLLQLIICNNNLEEIRLSGK